METLLLTTSLCLNKHGQRSFAVDAFLPQSQTLEKSIMPLSVYGAEGGGRKGEGVLVFCGFWCLCSDIPVSSIPSSLYSTKETMMV